MMTITKLNNIYRPAGVEKTQREIEDAVRTINRVSAIVEDLNARLVKDHKQHIQILTGFRNINGTAHLLVKFTYLDDHKYWEYVTGLVNDYTETFEEFKRTKTTLTIIGA